VAGLDGHKGVTDGLLAGIRGLEDFVNTEIQEIALEAAVAGENVAHETINSTPSSLSPGKPNRNWTFKMNQSLTSDVRKRGHTITLRVGWLDVKEGYFLIQNDGGTVNGVTVTPMNALMNAYTEMTKHLTRSGVKVP
jgi:hypothetical protein